MLTYSIPWLRDSLYAKQDNIFNFVGEEQTRSLLLLGSVWLYYPYHKQEPIGVPPFRDLMWSIRALGSMRNCVPTGASTSLEDLLWPLSSGLFEEQNFVLGPKGMLVGKNAEVGVSDAVGRDVSYLKDESREPKADYRRLYGAGYHAKTRDSDVERRDEKASSKLIL